MPLSNFSISLFKSSIHDSLVALRFHEFSIQVKRLRCKHWVRCVMTYKTNHAVNQRSGTCTTAVGRRFVHRNVCLIRYQKFVMRLHDSRKACLCISSFSRISKLVIGGSCCCCCSAQIVLRTKHSAKVERLPSSSRSLNASIGQD